MQGVEQKHIDLFLCEFIWVLEDTVNENFNIYDLIFKPKETFNVDKLYLYFLILTKSGFKKQIKTYGYNIPNKLKYNKFMNKKEEVDIRHERILWIITLLLKQTSYTIRTTEEYEDAYNDWQANHLKKIQYYLDVSLANLEEVDKRDE